MDTRPKGIFTRRLEPFVGRCGVVYENIEANHVLDDDALLSYSLFQGTYDADREGKVRLVKPESLYQDFLHHYHTSLEVGHQGIGRTYQRIRKHFHRKGLVFKVYSVLLAPVPTAILKRVA